MQKRTEMTLRQLESWIQAVKDLKRGKDPVYVINRLRREYSQA